MFRTLETFLALLNDPRKVLYPQRKLVNLKMYQAERVSLRSISHSQLPQKALVYKRTCFKVTWS